MVTRDRTLEVTQAARRRLQHESVRRTVESLNTAVRSGSLTVIRSTNTSRGLSSGRIILARRSTVVG